MAPVGVARARRCLADAARDVTAPAAGAPARVRSGDDGVVLVVLVPRRLLHRRRRRCACGCAEPRFVLPAICAQRCSPVGARLGGVSGPILVHTSTVGTSRYIPTVVLVYELVYKRQATQTRAAP